MADTLKSFLVEIGFAVDTASQSRADKAIDESETKATQATSKASEKRRKIEAKEAAERLREQKKTEKEVDSARKREDREEAKRDAARKKADREAEERRRKALKDTVANAGKIEDAIRAASGALIGNKLWNAVTGTASAYSNLQMQAQRTGAAPSKIAGLMYGLGQMGVGRGDAESSFNGFVKKLQTEPGLKSVLAGNGVRMKNVDGSDRDPAEVFAELGPYFAKLRPNVALQRAGDLGISQDTMLSLEKQAELKKKIGEFDNIKGAFGLNPEQASKEGREFTAAYDKVAADLHAVKDRVMSDFFVPLTAALKWFSEVLEGNGKVAVAFGEGFAALGALLTLKAIPPLLRLAKALMGLTSIAMPRWLLGLLGLEGLGAVAVGASAALAYKEGTDPYGNPEAQKGTGIIGMRRHQADRDEDAQGPLGTVKRAWKNRPAFLGGASRVQTTGSGKPGGWWDADRQKHAYDKLVAGGMPSVSAIGLISRWKNVESHNRGPDDANNIGGGHWGIAQWDRKRWSGVGGSKGFDDQLNKVVEEYKTGSGDGAYVRASSALRDAKTDAEAALGASAYERAEGYTSRRDGTDNFTGATLGGMADVRRNVTPAISKSRQAPPLADAPNPYGALVPISPNYVPGQAKGLVSGGYRSLGLGPDGKPVTLGGGSVNNSRGDTSFTQTNHITVQGDNSHEAVAEAVKATARRGGQDYIRNLEGSSQ